MWWNAFDLRRGLLCPVETAKDDRIKMRQLSANLIASAQIFTFDCELLRDTKRVVSVMGVDCTIR